MLKSAVPVVKEILIQFPKGGIDIESIARIVMGVTAVDRIHFIGYQVPSTNPLLGAFRRFAQQDAPYVGDVEIVEIRYALHLAEQLRLFVVCKELCHSLAVPESSHSVTEQAVDDLVTEFSIMSMNDAEPDFDLHSFGVEMLALITAIELMCPLPRRLHLANKYGANLDYDLISKNYGIPRPLAETCFRERYIKTMTSVYKNFKLIA